MRRRQAALIRNIVELLEVLKPFCIKGKENKDLAPIFQAIRIEVNAEMDALKMMLLQSVDLLSKGDRITVIAYHSIEDRIVKNFLRSGNFEGTF